MASRDHSRCFKDIGTQLIIVNLTKFDPDPTAHSYVRRLEKFLWRRGDQHILDTRLSGNPDADMPAAVVIIVEHREHFLLQEERRFAMGKLFGCAWDRQADPAHSSADAR